MQNLDPNCNIHTYHQLSKSQRTFNKPKRQHSEHLSPPTFENLFKIQMDPSGGRGGGSRGRADLSEGGIKALITATVQLHPGTESEGPLPLWLSIPRRGGVGLGVSLDGSAFFLITENELIMRP